MTADEMTSTTTTVPQFQFGENVRITVCASQGGRKYMEDRVHIECVRTPTGRIDYTYVAVYDGHGGAEASEYVRRHLFANIIEQPTFGPDSSDEDILTAIAQGFTDTHHNMWKVVEEWPKTASGYVSTAGTTASVAFIRNGKLYTGHVGDSAIVLGRRHPDGSIVGRRLTIDHKPDSPEEEQRIERAGGAVQSKAGVMRVVWSRPIRGHSGPVRRSTPREQIPFLAVARALGDLWSYNSDTRNFIVSPVPDTDVIELCSDDVCLVLASDGLTNVIRPQYAVDIVNTHEWRELQEERGIQAQLLSRPWHANHARWLLRHALRGWGMLRADNVTVISVIFDPLDSSLSNNASCVIAHDMNMNLERAFTEHPEAMIRISHDACQILKTAPVELVYSGSRDTNTNCINYSGPGFTSQSFESNATAPRSIVAQCIIDDNNKHENNMNESLLIDDDKLKIGQVSATNIVHTPNGALRSNHITSSWNGKSSSTTPSCKPKYYCRKHGLSCSKVIKINGSTPTKNNIIDDENQPIHSKVTNGKLLSNIESANGVVTGAEMATSSTAIATTPTADSIRRRPGRPPKSTPANLNRNSDVEPTSSRRRRLSTAAVSSPRRQSICTRSMRSDGVRSSALPTTRTRRLTSTRIVINSRSTTTATSRRIIVNPARRTRIVIGAVVTPPQCNSTITSKESTEQHSPPTDTTRLSVQLRRQSIGKLTIDDDTTSRRRYSNHVLTTTTSSVRSSSPLKRPLESWTTIAEPAPKRSRLWGFINTVTSMIGGGGGK